MTNKLEHFQHYLKTLYQKERWNEHHAFTNSNFLLEEVGELAEELLSTTTNDFIGELGDILQALLAVANHYTIPVSLLTYEKKDKSDDIHIPFLRLVFSLGVVAREVRRQEIGRHSHEEYENMTNDEKTEKLKASLLNALTSLHTVCIHLDIAFDQIIEENMRKMNEKYA